MIAELCQTLKFMNTISFLALFIKDTVVGFHPPHLPLALMRVNLFLWRKFKFPLSSAIQKSKWASIRKEAIESPAFGSRFLIFFPSDQNWNLTSFVFDCELLPQLWLPLCLHPSISTYQKGILASALVGEIPFQLYVHINRIHVIVWPYYQIRIKSAC